MQIDVTYISRVTSIQFDGVIIITLIWDDHMKIIYSKISKFIGIIRRVSYNLHTSVLLSLYSSTVNSHYEYCNVIQANGKIRYVDKLSTSQRKILFIVFKLEWNDHVDIYVKCYLFNIKGINIYHSALCIRLQNVCYLYIRVICLLLKVTFFIITRNSILIFM